MQFIVSKKEFIPPVIAPDIIETLGDDYEIWTYEDYERLPPLLVGVYSYSAIPKCLAPLSTQGLVKSGVFRLQREFVPGLYGNGVYVVVIDTGVNYAQEAFMTPEGKTKIAVLWDQNTDTVYSEDEINRIEKTESNLPKTKEDGKRPNILFLQLESFFDPTLVNYLDISEDPIPNFRKLMKEYSSGYYKVPSVGAGTANTEFETITGMSLHYFGPGEYPYKSILKETTM